MKKAGRSSNSDQVSISLLLRKANAEGRRLNAERRRQNKKYSAPRHVGGRFCKFIPMNKFLEITLTVLLFAGLACFACCLFAFLLMHASGHNIPYETNRYFGLRSVGGLLVFLLCWLLLKLVHRKQDKITAQNRAARNKK
jgi:hypothetical protein